MTIHRRCTDDIAQVAHRGRRTLVVRGAGSDDQRLVYRNNELLRFCMLLLVTDSGYGRGVPFWAFYFSG